MSYHFLEIHTCFASGLEWFRHTLKSESVVSLFGKF